MNQQKDTPNKLSKILLGGVLLSIITTQVGQSIPSSGAAEHKVASPSATAGKEKKKVPAKPHRITILEKLSGAKRLTDKQLVQLLYATGFRGNSLRTAWAIAKRESGGRPTAYNGNSWTGDNSYGLFQINMIGSLGPSRRATFHIKSNNELFNPVVAARAAHQMSRGGRDWSAWDIDSNGYNGGTHRSSFLRWLAKYPDGK
jgi:hypothetical protein